MGGNSGAAGVTVRKSVKSLFEIGATGWLEGLVIPIMTALGKKVGDTAVGVVTPSLDVVGTRRFPVKFARW